MATAPARRRTTRIDAPPSLDCLPHEVRERGHPARFRGGQDARAPGPRHYKPCHDRAGLIHPFSIVNATALSGSTGQLPHVGSEAGGKPVQRVVLTKIA